MTKVQKLYRCATEKNRKSKGFTTSSTQKQLLQKFLNTHTESSNPIEATFSRSLPVSKGHMSRFVPTGFGSHASYFAEKRETTFYEYIFHLLTHAHTNGDSVQLSIFTADVSVNSETNKNINRLMESKRNKILDPNTYEHSHEFMNNLSTIPSSITYKSVRAVESDNNHAIFNQKDIAGIAKELGQITARVIKSSGMNYTVRITAGDKSETLEVEKKFKHLST